MLQCFNLKQFFYIVAFFSTWLLVLRNLGCLEAPLKDPLDAYGPKLTFWLYAIKIMTLIPMPLTLTILITSTFYNNECSSRRGLFNNVPKSSSNYTICFRIVTRGDYAQMVRENVQASIDLLKRVGLKNFKIEVVCNKPIYLPKLPNTLELVVPESYTTKTGVKYKARSLQYALECNASKVYIANFYSRVLIVIYLKNI